MERWGLVVHADPLAPEDRVALVGQLRRVYREGHAAPAILPHGVRVVRLAPERLSLRAFLRDRADRRGRQVPVHLLRP